MDVTSDLACCCTVLLRESHYLLDVRSLPGALSQTICCLIHCLSLSVPDSHCETGPASVLRRSQRLTSHGAASTPGQQAAGKVDQLAGQATYGICYELSLLPQLPSKPKQL